MATPARHPTPLPEVIPLPEVGAVLFYEPAPGGTAAYVFEHLPFGISVQHVPGAARPWEASVWYREERVCHRAHTTLEAAARWAGHTWAERSTQEVE